MLVYCIYLQVFSIPLENCSQYDTCSSCASNVNPMCGWCVLESTCTRQTQCGADSTVGDWAQEPKQCIVSISLQQSSMAVDFVQNVSITGVVTSPFNVKGAIFNGAVVSMQISDETVNLSVVHTFKSTFVF